MIDPTREYYGGDTYKGTLYGNSSGSGFLSGYGDSNTGSGDGDGGSDLCRDFPQDVSAGD